MVRQGYGKSMAETHAFDLGRLVNVGSDVGQGWEKKSRPGQN